MEHSLRLESKGNRRRESNRRTCILAPHFCHVCCNPRSFAAAISKKALALCNLVRGRSIVIFCLLSKGRCASWVPWCASWSTIRWKLGSEFTWSFTKGFLTLKAELTSPEGRGKNITEWVICGWTEWTNTHFLTRICGSGTSVLPLTFHVGFSGCARNEWPLYHLFQYIAYHCRGGRLCIFFMLMQCPPATQCSEYRGANTWESHSLCFVSEMLYSIPIVGCKVCPEDRIMETHVHS